MNKKLIITLITILLLLFIFLLFIMRKGNVLTISEITKTLSKTETILVNKLILETETSDVNNEKQITNKNDINEIVKIISNGTKMAEDENIPYSGPKYKLKMLNKRKEIIVEIDFYFYTTDDNKNFGWICFDNDSTYYKIDADLLLEIINY